MPGWPLPSDRCQVTFDVVDDSIRLAVVIKFQWNLTALKTDMFCAQIQKLFQNIHEMLILFCFWFNSGNSQYSQLMVWSYTISLDIAFWFNLLQHPFVIDTFMKDGANLRARADANREKAGF